VVFQMLGKPDLFDACFRGKGPEMFSFMQSKPSEMLHQMAMKKREMIHQMVALFELLDPEITRIERFVTHEFPIPEHRINLNCPKTR
jgi:hypothetical protein